MLAGAAHPSRGALYAVVRSALMADRPLVMAITGASGAPYAVRLLEALSRRTRRAADRLGHGLRLLRTETDVGSIDALRERRRWRRRGMRASRPFDDADRGAAPASGSARNRRHGDLSLLDGHESRDREGTSRSLVERAADVALKERRTLILVPRETPLQRDPSREHAARDARRRGRDAGEPGFYHRPTRSTSSWTSSSREYSITSAWRTRSASAGAAAPEDA